MTKNSKHRRIESSKIYSLNLPDGNSLEATVSPCVFMIKGYPLQVQATLQLKDGSSGGSVFLVNRTLTAATATQADVINLLPTVGIKPCSRCSTPAFDPHTVETNREGLCESCFMSDLNREFAEILKKESQRLAKQDRKMKRRGMKYRVTAWIHPDEGDDYDADYYFPDRPSERQVSSILKRKGSTVLNDFQIVEL